MATTVDTTTNPIATTWAGQRKLDRCRNGMAWAAFSAAIGGNFEFHHSDTDAFPGVHDAGADLAGGTDATISFFIAYDASTGNEIAVACYHDGSNFVFVLGTFDAGRTTITWGTPITLNAGATNAFGDIVAFPFGTGWVAFVAWAVSGTDGAYVSRVDITAAGVASLNSTTGVDGSGRTPTIDFRHTGDGKTPHALPHLYVANQIGTQGIRFGKLAYSLGSWGSTSGRMIDLFGIQPSLVFDGTRVVMAYSGASGGAPTTEVKVRERDEADTKTDILPPPALPGGGTVESASVTYDGNGNLYLFASELTDRDLNYIKYDRGAGTWAASWQVTEFATVVGDASVKRGASDGAAGSSIEVLYNTGTGSPYNVRHARPFILNEPPTMPPWVIISGSYDVAAVLPLAWTHTDPDGDVQDSIRLKRVIGATTNWWNGTDFTATTETDVTTGVESLSLAIGWGSDGDANHSYYVATSDGQEWSDYSAALVVTPSAKVNPTITSPADGATVATALLTATHTVAEQSAQQYRLLSASDVALSTTGKVPTATATPHEFSYLLQNNTAYKVELTTWNAEDLASDVVVHDIDVDFVEPPAPTAAVTVHRETVDGVLRDAALDVEVTNPAPSGPQPAVTGNVVYKRVVGNTGDGTPVKRGLAPNDSWRDWVVASTSDANPIAYEYRVVALAANGAFASSAWTS